MTNSRRARAAGHTAQRAGETVEGSQSFGLLVRAGLIAYGVVHLLVAWIAVRLAWWGSGQQASQNGAFQQMATTSIGRLLLWVTAVGLFALTLWQLFEAGWGHRDAESDRARVASRLGSLTKAVVYGVLAAGALSTAAGSPSSGSAGEKTLTAKLLSVTFGQVAVIIVGIVVVVMGGRLVYRGVRRKFTDDLRGDVGRGVVRLGQAGYLAKGVVLAIVGVLFVIAAITFDPQKAGGLDTALRTLRQQPYGPIMLTLLAIGIACFGLYCLAWSGRAKRS